MSSNGDISGSTSVAAGCWDGSSSSACFSVLSFLVGDVLSFSDLVGFLPGLYLCPAMDVKNLFLLT